MRTKPTDLRTYVRLPRHIGEALAAHALSLGVSPTKAVQQIVLAYFTEGDALRAFEKRVTASLDTAAERLLQQQTEFVDALADNIELLAQMPSPSLR